MNITRLEYLFQLSLNQKASEKDMEEMADLMTLPENEEEVKELIFKAYEMPKEELDINPKKVKAILNAIYQAEGTPEKSHKSSPAKSLVQWFSIAATIVVLLSAGLLFFNYKTKPLVQTVKQQKQLIIPGGNKAMLTLADGSKVILDDSDTGKIASQGNIQIVKTANGRLAYDQVKPSSLSETGVVEYNTIETPRGGQYQVELPDGTVVWLNASSKLKYPVVFTGRERKVEMNGEAYFEVAKNKKLPFRVVSGQQIVEVLGTHFNMNNYKDENDQKTTLLEGSVSVSVLKNTSLLKPGQQARIGKNESNITISAVDIEDVIAWKNGYFRFRSEGLESIMRKLSRWYDVNVEFKGEVSDEKFNGVISRAKNINQVLEMLETTNAVHFKTEGRRLIVMK